MQTKTLFQKEITCRNCGQVSYQKIGKKVGSNTFTILMKIGLCIACLPIGLLWILADAFKSMTKNKCPKCNSLKTTANTSKLEPKQTN